MQTPETLETLETTEAAPLSDEQRLLRWAAGLSFAAAVVHGLVTPEHMTEWWGYGVFFFFATLAQAIYGVLLLLQPWTTDGAGRARLDVAEAARPYYWLGIVGNASIIVLYLITRTVGIPFFGPEAGEVEDVTALSVVSKLIEVLLVACLVLLLRLSRAVSSR